jgi:hypothetical protein
MAPSPDSTRRWAWPHRPATPSCAAYRRLCSCTTPTTTAARRVGAALEEVRRPRRGAAASRRRRAGGDGRLSPPGASATGADPASTPAWQPWSRSSRPRAPPATEPPARPSRAATTIREARWPKRASDEGRLRRHRRQLLGILDDAAESCRARLRLRVARCTGCPISSTSWRPSSWGSHSRGSLRPGARAQISRAGQRQDRQVPDGGPGRPRRAWAAGATRSAGGRGRRCSAGRGVLGVRHGRSLSGEGGPLRCVSHGDCRACAS